MVHNEEHKSRSSKKRSSVALLEYVLHLLRHEHGSESHKCEPTFLKRTAALDTLLSPARTGPLNMNSTSGAVEWFAQCDCTI